jgi:hypothetical protein
VFFILLFKKLKAVNLGVKVPLIRVLKVWGRGAWLHIPVISNLGKQRLGGW